MTQVFLPEEGTVIPVALIEAGPCSVVQVKTKEHDGYEAVQVGFMPAKKSKKSAKGKQFRVLKEFRLPKPESYEVGNSFNVSIFQEGEKVGVSGISKGKGFQGGVKRHGFSGRNATHGVKHEQRKIGSTGSRFPQHVIKGRRMPGRMGADRVTVKNLKIVKIDPEKNLIALKGAIPGIPGTVVEIRAMKE